MRVVDTNNSLHTLGKLGHSINKVVFRADCSSNMAGVQQLHRQLGGVHS